ncbi:MAG: adenosylcobinamide-GDP ribazoletransferase, partial [Clostridia bacterium]|nr:adenosylcobinamide-GDP ribazoletransferase [Clostridia bacterium]
MKTFFETILVAFGMFSRVPVPQVEWNEKNRKYSMLAFPLVGLVLGLCWVIVASVCRHFGLPALLTGGLLTALPVLVAGGIHLDGYADAVDALSS